MTDSAVRPALSKSALSKSALSKSVATALTAVLLAGIGVALWLTWIKLRLDFDPNYQSSCNLGDKLNCDRVQTSSYSSVFGFPLAIWGASAYVVAIVATWMAQRETPQARLWLAALAVGGLGACAHSLYLAYISSFVIGAYCIFCISMYAVNLVTTGTAVRAFMRGGSLGDATGFLTHPKVLGGLAASGIAALLILVPSYNSVRASMMQDRIAHDTAQMQAATTEVAPASGSNGQTAGDASDKGGKNAEDPASKSNGSPAATAGAATNRAADGPGIITHSTEGFRYSEVILRKGRAFFEVPVTEHDWPLGPKDAPVTFVMFGDFECGYCRALFRNMKPLKDKYKGQVRWVFKHWPLNNNCNKVMKGVQHPQACIAAKASNCAGEQGKFWPMHDEIYSQDLRLNALNLREWAGKAGVDLAKYDNCMSKTEPHPKMGDDIRAGRFAKIAGTPRTYINGHLVPGVVATEILEHFIKSGIAAAKNAPEPVADALAQHGMVQVKTAAGAFWIDAYEASIDTNGAARSQVNTQPAEASWLDAQAACKKAGKRLCSEEEWVSGCTGAPAVDNNHNGDFTDDAVEGTLYPYGNFPEGGRCNDNQPSAGGAVKTGSMAECRSPSGIFDMSANLAEWTGQSEEAGRLSGTDFRWGAKATCLNRQKRFGLGYRNTTTGFRCCADKAVAPPSKDAEIVVHTQHGATGKPVPQFEATLRNGQKIGTKDLQQGVWIVSFYASWCGPCRKELPDLNEFYGKQKANGLEILAIGVDMTEPAMRSFIKDLKLDYKVAFDPTAVSMGAFGVRGMPTAFLVVNGKIQQRLVGINADKVAAFKAAAVSAQSAK